MLRFAVKSIKVLSIIFIILSVSGYFGVDYYFSKLELKKRTGSIVQQVPTGYLEQRFTPYTGAHPSMLERPDDTFPYPIEIGSVGPVEPLFAGPKQYPFACDTERSGLGQPVVDNQEGIGTPVFEESDSKEKSDKVVGYSKDCSAPTQARYFYNREGTESFFPLSTANNDIAKVEIDGKEVDFIVRLEMGTLNRFIYGIAAIKGVDESSLEQPDGSNWNGRLLYQFRGGVGIGRRQGKMQAAGFLNRRYDALKMGYAIAYSTGTQTKNHYNIWLSEEIVMRLKKHFSSLYGKPKSTFGIGGSGGAIQQYLLAQNRPGLIDGAVALYSYPDMVTQVIYAFDCELLEYYFDVVSDDNAKWDDMSNRVLIQGLNGNDSHSNRFSYYYALANLVNGVSPVFANGMTECANGWRGLVQLTNNPHFVHFGYSYDSELYQQIHWTHWEDLSYFYGHDERGYARQAWDNSGVQYGLEALKNSAITAEEFIDLNAKVGGWKPPHEFAQERYWKIIKDTKLSEISPWSHHNMTHDNLDLSQAIQNSDGTLIDPNEMRVAPRTEGDSSAIEALYRSGHIFLGNADIPIVDVRHYLEDELDMHHFSASFVTRSRMIEAQGHADNQLIWVTRKPHNPVEEALKLLEEWVDNRAVHPVNDLLASKPESAVDRCYTEDGKVIGEGSGVWDGEWNRQSRGECTNAYPVFSTSRLVSGDAYTSYTFKCQLQSVASAIDSGVYGSIDMEPYRAHLEKIFPEGVCNYAESPVGEPARTSLFKLF